MLAGVVVGAGLPVLLGAASAVGLDLGPGLTLLLGLLRFFGET